MSASEKRTYTRADLQARRKEQEEGRAKTIIAQLVDEMYKMILATSSQGLTGYYRQVLMTALPDDLRLHIIKMSIEELKHLFPDVNFDVDRKADSDYIVGIRVDWS